MMTRAELKTLAKEQLKGNLWMLILCILIFEVIVGAPTAILARVDLQQFGGIINLIVAGPLSLGLTWIFLGITRGEKPEVGKLFEGFNYFLNSFLLSLLGGIFIALWTLLLIVPGIIKAYSYSMMYFVLAENPEMKPMDALKESERIMKGHKMELFVLELSFIPWILLCVVTCGIASLYVVPYVQLTTTHFYLQIKDQASVVDVTPAE